MRKEYVNVPDAEGDETEFVRSFWAEKWAIHRLSSEEMGRLESSAKCREEWHLMVPHLPPGAEVLDGGCGLGEWTIALTKHGFRVRGIDLDGETVACLKAQYPEARFDVGDLRAQPYEDESFDAIFSWGAFEHFEDGVRPCLIEAKRVLRRGGQLFFTVPFQNLRHLASSAGSADIGPPFDRPLRFYQYRFTRNEIAFEARAAGFHVQRVLPIHKEQGLARMIHQHFGASPGTRINRIASRILSFLPGSFISHMLFVHAILK